MINDNMTIPRVLALFLLYGALYVIAWNYYDLFARKDKDKERTTFKVIGITWALSTLIANYLLYRIGLMSFLPWVNNVLHTCVWIGIVLTTLYMGVRRCQPLWMQMVVFATFSLVIKVGEQILFGTWEHSHFFYIFKGNAAYVLGWSLADGLYPPLTQFGLRLLNLRERALLPV